MRAVGRSQPDALALAHAEALEPLAADQNVAAPRARERIDVALHHRIELLAAAR